MNSYILSIHNKWVELIKNGTKQYEFRSFQYTNIQQGDKIYICETKRTEHISRIGQGYLYCAYCGTKDFNQKCISLVTGEFIVKQVWICAEGQADIKGKYHYIPKDNYLEHQKLYYQNKNRIISDEVWKIKLFQLQNNTESKELTNQLDRNVDNNIYSYILAFEISELNIYIRPKLIEEFNFKKAPQFYYKVKENNE